jgi:hypothetical protein
MLAVTSVQCELMFLLQLVNHLPNCHSARYIHRIISTRTLIHKTDIVHLVNLPGDFSSRKKPQLGIAEYLPD